MMRAVLHLTLYYGLQAELEASVNESYERVVNEGLNVSRIAADLVPLTPHLVARLATL